MPTFVILANCAEYHFFHRLCIYQDRATKHLRPNSRKKKASPPCSSKKLIFNKLHLSTKSLRLLSTKMSFLQYWLQLRAKVKDTGFCVLNQGVARAGTAQERRPPRHRKIQKKHCICRRLPQTHNPGAWAKFQSWCWQSRFAVCNIVITEKKSIEFATKAAQTTHKKKKGQGPTKTICLSYLAVLSRVDLAFFFSGTANVARWCRGTVVSLTEYQSWFDSLLVRE